MHRLGQTSAVTSSLSLLASHVEIIREPYRGSLQPGENVVLGSVPRLTDDSMNDLGKS